MRFVMLGSGAVRDNPRRAGPSQLVQVAGENLVFDLGRSACTNLAAEIGCEEVDRLYLTHLHFDHIVDLPYLAFVGWVKGRQSRLEVVGPHGTRNFVERIIRPPFEEDIRSRIGHGKDDGPLDPMVLEVSPGSDAPGGETYRIETTSMDHAGMPTLSYRIDTDAVRIVITGDGIPDADFPDFCRGAEILAIECSGTPEFLAEQPWGSWHITPEQIGKLAAEAEVKRVMIKHLVMEDVTGDRNAPHKMAEQIRGYYDGEVIVGEDGMGVELGGDSREG